MRQSTSAQGELGADVREAPSREQVARAALRSLGAPSFPPPSARHSFHDDGHATQGSGVVRPTRAGSQTETYSRPRYAAYSHGASKQAYFRDVPASASPPPSPGYHVHSATSHYDLGEQSSSQHGRLPAESPASRMPSLSSSCSSRNSAPLASPPEGGTDLGSAASGRSEASIERVAAALHLRPCDVRSAVREQERWRVAEPVASGSGARPTDKAAQVSRPGSPGLDRETLHLVLEAMRAEDQRVAQLASYRAEYLRAEALRMEVELQQQRQHAIAWQQEASSSMRQQLQVPSSPPPPYAPVGIDESVRLSDARDAQHDDATYARPRPAPSGAVMPPPDLPRNSEPRRLSERQVDLPPNAAAPHHSAPASLMQSPLPGLAPHAHRTLHQTFPSAPTRTHRSMDDYALALPPLIDGGAGVRLASFAPRPRSASHAQDLYQHSAPRAPVRALPHRHIRASASTLRDASSHAMRSHDALVASPLSLADSQSERRRDSVDSMAGSKRPRPSDEEDAAEQVHGQEGLTGRPCAASPDTCSSLAEEAEQLSVSDGAGAVQPARSAPSHLEIMARLKDKVTARLAAKEQASRAAGPSRPSSASGSREAAARRRAASHSRALETPALAAGNDSMRQGLLPGARQAPYPPSGGIEALLTAASLPSEHERDDALAEPAV